MPPELGGWGGGDGKVFQNQLTSTFTFARWTGAGKTAGKEKRAAVV